MKKLLIVIALILLMMLLIASSVRLEKDNVNILIDAGKPHKIFWPCEIDFVGEDGEEGFRIGPKVVQGWRDRKLKNGYAIYNFYAPTNGEYTLWGYALWDDVCTNAVFTQIDQGKETIMGNDPVYKKWHWVRGTSTYLTKGSHTLTLSNHSNNVALQKLLLMGSKYKVPSESDSYFMDIFYDDFNGCDQGNFPQWKKIRGNWIVSAETDPVCANANSLIGKSTAEDGCEIRIGSNEWENYSFDISCSIEQWDQGAFAQVKFGMDNTDDCLLIKITPVASDLVELCLIKNDQEKEIVLGKANIAKKDFKLSLTLKEESLVLFADGDDVIQADRQLYRGGISLFLAGDILIKFDDIHVRYLANNK